MTESTPSTPAESPPPTESSGSSCGTPATGPRHEPAAEGPFASCVLCQEPTEYARSVKGITLCPVCEWQEAQRNACSG
ncbi:hypothetical protein ACGFYZ_40860 [Streptomyces sp. NPDC048330]|uniref:hypothetical protein n=1 Tax=Streptomyces sp. NPDC048330 TaxID=3365533 RepID=UPI003714E2F8